MRLPSKRETVTIMLFTGVLSTVLGPVIAGRFANNYVSIGEPSIDNALSYLFIFILIDIVTLTWAYSAAKELKDKKLTKISLVLLIICGLFTTGLWLLAEMSAHIVNSITF